VTTRKKFDVLDDNADGMEFLSVMIAEAVDQRDDTKLLGIIATMLSSIYARLGRLEREYLRR
jgi:hypothetical protein